MADGHLIFDTKILTDGFSSGLKNITKGLAVGTAAAGAAFVGVSKMALDSVASLEQNIGGVETLFKDSAQTVIDNANRAYATAGMSANAYMENVTSFSASLLQSTSGDTAKAAQIADTAMTDMSDNANKMGTSMESITNAYQGFAKQNYTMLDNLKLGYGGTKSEMERLLADAQKLTGVKYDINNLSDVYSAIHAIQENLDITGTTAKEAATTIEGSMGSAKAAFDNLLNGSGTAEEFANSFSTAAKNIIKNLEEIVPRLAATIPEIGKLLINDLSDMLSGDGVSKIMSAATSVITGFVRGCINALPSILSAGVQIITSLAQGISSNLPGLVESGIEIIGKIGDGLKTAIPEFLSNALPMLEQFSKELLANAGLLVDAGIDFITNIVQGLVDSLPDLIAYGPTIITNLANIINENVPKLIIAGANIIIMLIQGIIENIPNLIAHFPDMIKAIISVIGAVNWLDLGASIIKGIANGIKSLISNIPQILKQIGTTAFNGIKNINWSSVGTWLISKIAYGITSLINKIPSSLTQVGRQAMTAFKSIDWLSLGKNVISGIASGITGAAGEIASAAKRAASNALSAAKRLLGIHSPSRVARDQIGKMYGKGLALGITDEIGEVSRASEKLADKVVTDIEAPDYSAISAMARNSVLSTTASMGKSIVDGDNSLAGNNDGTNWNKWKSLIKEALQEMNLTVEMDREKVGKVLAPTMDDTMSDIEGLKARGC